MRLELSQLEVATKVIRRQFVTVQSAVTAEEGAQEHPSALIDVTAQKLQDLQTWLGKIQRYLTHN